MIDPIQLILQTIESSPEVLESLSKRLEGLEQLVERLNHKQEAGGKQGEEAHKKVKKGADEHQISAGSLVAAYEKIHLAFELLKEAGAKAFESLITQNIELRQQIQSTSAQLVSNQDVLVGGKVVRDTLEAITAAGKPVQEQIQKLRQDALQVSGVTSADLVGSFEALSQATGTLKINLAQSETLAVRLTAQGTTLGLGAQQINSEVQAISRGEINSYNTLAKSLHLTNERVQSLAAEGKLYDYIYQKTQAGVEGQKIAAASYAGVTSNIKEVIQLVTQAAGAPLLDSILKQLTSVYKFLSTNQEGLTAFAKEAGDRIAELIDLFGEAGAAIAEALAPAFEDAKVSGANFADIMIAGFRSLLGLVTAIAPFVGRLVDALTIIGGTMGTIIEKMREFTANLLSMLSKVPGLQKALGAVGASLRDPIQDADEALKSYSDRADQLGKDALETEAKLLTARREGSNLTAAQLEAHAKLGKQARGQLSDIDGQIKLLKQFTPLNDQEKAAQQQKLDLLQNHKKVIEDSLKGLKGASEETTFQNKTLDKIGNTYEQLASKAKAAKADINNTNDADKAGQRAKDFIDLTKQQIELGAVNRESAIKDLEAIANNEGLKVEARQNAQKAIDDLRKKGQDQEKADLETQLATVEGAVKVGRLGEVQGAQEVTKLKKQELDKQLEFVQAEIAREEVLKQEQVKEQIAGIDTQITALQKAKQDALAKKDKDGANTADKSILDLQKQKENAQASLKIDGDRVKDLKNQRQKLSVQSKVAEEEGEERLQAAKLAVLERAQKKTEDAVKLSQVKQETEVQNLLNQRAIRQVDADELRIKEKEHVDEQELALAKKNAEELEKLPKLSDPAKEGARQEKIRAAQLRTAEITKQLAEDEGQRQAAAFKKYEDLIDQAALAFKNSIEAEEQPLRAQQLLLDAQSQSLDSQNKLLEARKDLQGALTGFVTGELEILSKTTSNEHDRQTIAEVIAAVKLKSLEQQQIIEQQVLEIQLKQEQAALRKEKIQNQINQAQNTYEQAQAKADAQKTLADPKSTDAQKEAALANVTAKQQTGIGLQLTGALLDQRGKLEDTLGNEKRASLASKQALDRDQANIELVQSLPQGVQRDAKENLQRELTQRLFGTEDIGALGSLTDQIENSAQQRGGLGRFRLPGSLTPVAGNLSVPDSPEVARLTKQLEDFGKPNARAIGQLPNFPTPQQPTQRATATLPPIPGVNLAGELADRGGLGGGLARLESVVKQGFQALIAKPHGNVTLNNTINNQITGGEANQGKLQKLVEQEVLNSLYSVAQLAKQQKGKAA